MCALLSSYRIFILWVVMLQLFQTSSGQQYTGVKSVSSSAEVTRVSAHSARSVDGRIPVTDSNIINLAITPINRSQSFSAAKGRNLGLANDASSFNTIPAGVNNELSNIDVRGLTLQSNPILRDSYGNPVTPFTDLASADLEPIGFKTNVNRGSNFQSPSNGQIGQLNFKVPSYASGIIEPIVQPNVALLPPNPEPVEVGAPVTTTTAKPLDAQQQFLPFAKIPTVEQGKILFAQKPVNGLLPPLFPDQLPVVYNVEVDTERSSIFVRDPFEGSIKTSSTPQSLNAQNSAAVTNGEVGFKTDVTQQAQSLQPTLGTANRFPGPLPAHNNLPSHALSETTTKPTLVQKYSGGFGGSAGFLGNQQNIGTAYTTTAKPMQFPTVQSVTKIQSLNPVKPPNTFSSTARPNDKSTVDKYVGSFGGSPGFLGNQATIGTAYTKPLQTNSPPTFSIPATHISPLPSSAQQFGSEHSAPAPVPAIHTISAESQLPIVEPTSNKFTGSFNAGSHSHSIATRPTIPSIVSQNPQAVRPFPVTNTFNGGNKFNGSFGGAPGLLGNQQRPGTHVTPSGTAGSSAQQNEQQKLVGQYLQHTNAFTESYSGIFGGPPGILRPYDNNKG
ncbi:uncharacterized protein LOC128730366 [Anopheles nili]|uniref:uncharacterized protein LOC128730366 n=1 Tax=Anopheles nili TaxID=185578 RepID=UPI00237C0C98|nr:uncharacterized protein LOC128730366 [Anopheles nili]